MELSIPCNSTTTIAELKAKIQAKEGTSPEHQLLSYNNRGLGDDDRTIQDYGIQSGDVVDLSPPSLMDPTERPPYRGRQRLSEGGPSGGGTSPLYYEYIPKRAPRMRTPLLRPSRIRSFGGRVKTIDPISMPLTRGVEGEPSNRTRSPLVLRTEEHGQYWDGGGQDYVEDVERESAVTELLARWTTLNDPPSSPPPPAPSIRPMTI